MEDYSYPLVLQIRAYSFQNGTQDSVDGRLSFFFEKVGFSDMTVSGHVKTRLGTLDIMIAEKSMN